MAKGNVAKQTIADKLKKLFGNNFILSEGNKVYVWEDDGGERIQVALTMTCPKTPVGAAMASPEPASAFDNYITPNFTALSSSWLRSANSWLWSGCVQGWTLGDPEGQGAGRLG